MNGKQLKAFREQQKWSQTQTADLLNEALDRKYGSAQISRWENAKAPIPGHVATFLDTLAADFPAQDDFTGPLEYETPPDFTDLGDTAPPAPPGTEDGGIAAAFNLPLGSSAYARVCEEMFELIATAVGMVGAVTGNDKLRVDGEIILADKKNLGKAYGKLAETNPTFQRMLTGMTSSGAVLEVALVSGITFGKVMRNHQRPALTEPSPEPEQGPPPGSPEAMLHVVQA